MDDLTNSIVSPMLESARQITKPQVDLVTEVEMEIWEAMEPETTAPVGVRRLIATVRHYRRKFEDELTINDLYVRQIAVLQQALTDARAKLIEAQQLIGEVK